MNMLRWFPLLVLFLAVPGQAGDKKEPPRYTVSKETTYVTVRDTDGFIDYQGELNRRFGKGVTAANNANVLLWKAIGPRPEGAAMPDEFFELMGTKAPPDKGDYFIDYGAFLRSKIKAESIDKYLDDLSTCPNRPWKRGEKPLLAGWIDANEKSLAVVIEATRRPHYFAPLVPDSGILGKGLLLGARLSSVQRCRSLCSALTIRAMMRIGQERFEDAWNDLLACHRLARLVGRGPTLIDGLVGIAIDSNAVSSQAAFLEHVPTDAKKAVARLREVQQLPPMPSLSDKLDATERFMFLEIVLTIDRRGWVVIRELAQLPLAAGEDPNEVFALDKIDWDPVLRLANQRYDRLASLVRLEDRNLRRRRWQQIDKETKEAKEAMPANVKKLRDPKVTPQDRGKIIGEMLVTLLIPAVGRVQEAAERGEQNQRNLQVALALTAYRHEHGRYPKTLDDLAPKYLPKVPLDVFSGKGLIYRPSEKGYLLCSIGVNGVDDQGRGYDDNPPGDDLVIRLSAKK